MKRTIVLAGMLLLAGSLAAQDTYYSIFSYAGPIPEVGLNTRAATFQAALLPRMYTSRSEYGDLRWVRENDSTFTAFWDSASYDILHILSELSGLKWYETEFDMHLLRYAPSPGCGDPAYVPVGGIVDENGIIEAMPADHRWQLDLIYQLAHRMLAQAVQPENSVYLTVGAHPLMRASPYRRDVMAMLLALTTAQNVISIDSTSAAWNSAFWNRWFPGRHILEEYLIDEWILTPEEPLISWINREGYGSQLVRATRPPRPADGTDQSDERLFVEDLPIRGDLGFSVAMDDLGRLIIDKIDIYRLAYANNLRKGDVIRRVEGQLVRTHRDLVEKILAGLDEQGAVTLSIIRDGQPQDIVFQRIMLPYWGDDDLGFDMPFDTISIDTIPADTIAPDTLNTHNSDNW